MSVIEQKVGTRVTEADYITLGAGCTLGTKVFVHYGVTLDDDAVIDPDSFLMKGGQVTSRARWRGNPATDISHLSITDTTA